MMAINSINKRRIAVIIMLTLFCGIIQRDTVLQARTVSLTSTKKIVNVGRSLKIRLKGANKKQLKKAKWSVKSGKKCIKIKVSKSKASIKVTGKKTGKAKVLCKVAGKKLVCKITVKAVKNKQNKPAVTVTTPVNKATPVPAATLAPTPQATIMPVESERPTHIPTEDKLMAEPAKCTELPRMDENGGAIERAEGYDAYYFYGTNVLRFDIETLTYSSVIDVPEDAINQFDVSEKQNKSVIAWYTDRDGNNKYEMTIAQTGGVIANEDSSYLCCGLSDVRGFENLYTEKMKNLTRAFYQYIPTRSPENEVLDLGDYFDTSGVEIFDGMFERVSTIFRRLEIRLGKRFSVQSAKSSDGICYHGGYNYIEKFIAPNREVADWFLKNQLSYSVVVEE
ncbi:hypothetical protein [Eubacterium xylanophilum]|uniref:hypothetical protein n=1 Tax=Eubacterium xylanophilum TaxID=39497 RepID=UPI00047EDFB6|nr:hypothetical protein [Eubacterium xylanophilum]